MEIFRNVRWMLKFAVVIICASHIKIALSPKKNGLWHSTEYADGDEDAKTKNGRLIPLFRVDSHIYVPRSRRWC